VEDEQAVAIKAKLVRAQQRREPLVVGRDCEYKPISIPPNEAQFIEAQQLTATQIAAIYGVMPRKAGGIHGDSQTYSNVSMDQISEITDTLDPWLVRFESALARCLPAAQYATFNRDARIRHDIQTRFAAYHQARDMGLMTQNEVRDLEELEPLTAGVGDDPLPLQVLVAMARGIKEIPKSFESLVTESPADTLAREQALTLAKEAKVAQPPPPIYPTTQAPVNGNGQSPNGKQPANQGNGHG
jgi:hypothetical protein